MWNFQEVFQIILYLFAIYKFTNLHEVMLPNFTACFLLTMFFWDNKFVLKCFRRAQEVEMDEKEQKGEISVETAHNLVNKSLELFDCSLLKNVKPDRTLQTGKRKMCKVTNTFRKAVAIALDEPTLGESTAFLNCCLLVELVKEKLVSS